MAGQYVYLLVNAVTGSVLGELPLTLSQPFTRVLNGCGELQGTIPLYHPVTSMIGGGLYEITVLRNGVPIWNGPMTLSQNISLRDQTVPVTAREASWWLGKRVLEVNKHWNADIFYIVRQLVTYMTSKVSTTGDGYTPAGSSLASTLANFAVSPASGNSGITREVWYSGTARHLINDIFLDLASNDVGGFDYRMNYSGTANTCTRTLTLGAPSLGTTHEDPLVEDVLYDFTKSMDWERAANRVHTVYAGGLQAYTLQNKSSVTTDGNPLVESTFDQTDTSNLTTVQALTRNLRLVCYPPITDHTFSWQPDVVFPFGWCDLGDKVYLNISPGTILTSAGHRRIVQMAYQPEDAEQDTPELVIPTISIPLDTVV